jgi:methylthioribose-1-phosphate isomerase
LNIHGKHYRTIWLEPDGESVGIIDQRELPFRLVVLRLREVDEVGAAIKDMAVRGAGLIGTTAGYGMFLAALAGRKMEREEFLGQVREAGEKLRRTRPTAVNLAWAVERQLAVMERESTVERMVESARTTAEAIADEDVEACRQIGLHGVPLIEEIAQRKGKEPVHILTHCNAGWLAFVDYGSATAPIYEAFRRGIPVHVWVDETRPRNQGARLTAFELAQQGVPHTVIVDNAGGHLMQRGLVDLVITGTDRTTYRGDVANKIGTYLKALAAQDNNIPFYVALPSSTFDWEIADGVRDIPIEERDASEVFMISGVTVDGSVSELRIVGEGSPAKNYGFDVTPARLVTGLITERGICPASEKGIKNLFTTENAGNHGEGNGRRNKD